MSKHKLIPYPVIAAAVRGDPEAVNRVLDFYSGYIGALSTRRGYARTATPALPWTRKSGAGSKQS